LQRRGGSIQSGGVKLCDIRLKAPVAQALPGRNIVVTGVTQATCDIPPTSHVVTVWLEFQNGRNWEQVVMAEGPLAGTCAEIPPPGMWIECRASVFNQCKDGRWRTKALVTGTTAQGVPFAFTPPEAPSTLVKCPQPIK
jgi:hypothetical protein